MKALRTKFFLRGKQGVESLWGLQPKDASSKITPHESLPVADLMEFSADGSKIVLVNMQTGFTVRETESSKELLQVANPGIQAVAWSPLGSHVLTWERPQKESANGGNLIVWNASTGQEVSRFNQKSYSRDVRLLNPCCCSEISLSCALVDAALAISAVVLGRSHLRSPDGQRHCAL